MNNESKQAARKVKAVARKVFNDDRNIRVKIEYEGDNPELCETKITWLKHGSEPNTYEVGVDVVDVSSNGSSVSLRRTFSETFQDHAAASSCYFEI